MANKIHLVLGGARSGKSAFAERLAQQYGGDSCVYVATAEARDGEMLERVAKHRNARNLKWQTIESSQSLADVILKQIDTPCIMIDCLTLWLSKSMELGTWDQERKEFLNALEKTDSNIVMVTNEVGQGIVPLGKLTRQFVDEAGWLHQDIAKIATDVTMVIAGLPQTLKG